MSVRFNSCLWIQNKGKVDAEWSAARESKNWYSKQSVHSKPDSNLCVNFLTYSQTYSFSAIVCLHTFTTGCSLEIVFFSRFTAIHPLHACRRPYLILARYLVGACSHYCWPAIFCSTNSSSSLLTSVGSQNCEASWKEHNI